MKRTLMAILAVVMLATMFAGTACSKVGVDVKGTKEPTVLATEIPTAEPTPEPTTTPIPDDWYIDPSGIIPPTVEILIPDHDAQPWCIANVDGTPMLQYWGEEGLIEQWTIPEKLLEVESIKCMYGEFKFYDVLVTGYYNSEQGNDLTLLYYEWNGKYILEKASSHYVDASRLLIGTPDGKAIAYHWGKDFYGMQDFGKDAEVEATQNAGFVVDGDYISWGKIDLNTVPLKDKKF